MNKEQFKALIAALEPMCSTENRRHAFDCAMAVFDGTMTIDEIFAETWGAPAKKYGRDATWGVPNRETWNAVNPKSRQ